MEQQQQLQQQQLQQLQQLQQQQQQQQQPQHFIPIHAERAISPSGGIMLRHAANKVGGLKANAVLGISIPAPVTRSSMLPVATPIATNAANATNATNATNSSPNASPNATTAATESATVPPNNPLVGMVQDVIFAMILNIPALRTKLQVILDNPSLIGAEISKVYDELQSKLTPQELEQLKSYAGQDSSRRTIGTVMQTAFTNIMADGKIDMSDAPHFLALIHDCITLFSADSANGNSVTLNSNTVITFLYFVLKCILILTLDGPEEDAALVMLDGSFKLVKLTVLPLIAKGKWCCCFNN
jgi:hypothetical protein